MKNKGFTILEILIALSIASIAIITLYKLHLMNIDTGINQKFDLTAPLLARQKIDEISGKRVEELNGNFDGDYSDYSFSVKQEKIITDDFNKIRVDVIVTKGNLSYSLRKYIFADEN